jgi:hypothetical protein
MVKRCIACSNQENRSNNISFHRFPSDKTQQHQWLKRLNRLDIKDVSNKRVCGVHFDASSFMVNLTKKKSNNTTQDVKKRLKKEALPMETVTDLRLIDTTTQTDLDMISLSALFEKLTLFESTIITSTMSIERFKDDDYNINYFTGFRSYKIYKMVFELLQVRKEYPDIFEGSLLIILISFPMQRNSIFS